MIQNYNSSFNGMRLLRTLKPDRGSTRTRLASGIVKNCSMQLVLFLFMLLGVTQSSFAQVSSYTFAQSNGTYTAITGGTLHGTAIDNNNYSFTLPFTFTYNGTGYTVARPTSNGFLVLGGSAPSTSQYTPLSSGTTNFAISAMARDLNSTIRSEVIGTAPNRVYVCQWSSAYRYAVGTGENLNAQIRLYEGTNKIEIIYGTFTTTNTAVATGPMQVGLRGSAATDFNTRTTTTDWTATTAGGTNAATMAGTSTVKPASGLTYTFTAPTDPFVTATTLTAFGNVCKDVTSNANSFTVTGGNLTGDVTVGALTGYTYSATTGGTYTSTLTLTPTSGSLSAVSVFVKLTPTALTTYNGNIPLTGGGLAATVNVAASGTGVNTAPGVSANGNATTVSMTDATITGATINSLGCTAVTAYGIEYSTTSGFTGGTGTQVAGTGFSGIAGGTFSASLSALTAGTTYYYRAYATNGGGTTYSSTVSSFAPLASGQVGGGTGTTTATMPVSSYFGYSYTQQLYLATEINATGTPGNTYITKVRFLPSSVQTPLSTYNNWTIYIGNTAKTSFSSTTDWVASTDLTQVFSGTIATLTNGAWVEITLSTPFLWDGTSNLVIAVDENADSYTNSDSTGTAWQAFTATNRGIYVRSDTVNPTAATPGTGTTQNTVPQVQMVMTTPPACGIPSSIVGAATAFNAGTATWVAPVNGTPTGYEWELRTSGAAGSGATGRIDNGTTTSAGTISYSATLSGNTTYTLYVRTNCSGTYSSWSAGSSFTTPCTPLTTFPYTENFNSVTTPALPSCYVSNDVNGDGDKWISYSTYGTGSSNCAGLYTDLNSGANNDYLILPAMTLTGNQRLRFSVAARSSGEPNDYRVVLSTTNTNPASFTTVLRPLTTVSNTTQTPISWIDLTPYTGTVYIAIHVPSGGADGYYLYVDDITVDTAPVRAIASGDFAVGSNWSNGTGPVCGQLSQIPSGITMTVSSGTITSGQLEIASGGALNVSGGTLTVGCTNNDSYIDNSGTINVSGGTLAVNGSIVNNTGSTFIQSAGNITIDGNNNNTPASSVASGTPLLAFGTTLANFATGTVTLNGGTLTIVDPHTATTNTSAYALYGNFASGVAFTASPNHTLQFGDGTSTQAGGNASGFYYNLFVGSGRMNLGSVTVNNPGAVASRIVTQVTTTGMTGNFTVTSGTYTQGGAITYIGGNIVVNSGGIYVANGTTHFALISGTTVNAQTVAQSVTVNGTGAIQNLATTPTGNFDSITFKNTSATGVTINPLNQVVANAAVAASVRNNLTFDGKASTTGGKTLLYGTLATPGSGSLVVTSGGMVPGSAYGRGWNTAQTGTGLTGGSVPTGTGSQFPLIDENGNARHAWIERVSPTDAGIISMMYTAAAGTSPVSITDGAYTVDTRSNGKWSVSVLGTDMAATTYKLAVSGTTIFGSSPATAVARLVTDSAAIGTFQAGTTLPHAQRTDLTLAMLTGQDFYMGINSSDIPFLSVQNGNWNDGTTWNKGTVPTATDIVTISTGHTVTVDNTVSATAAVASALNVNAGGTLAVSANSLTVTNAVTNAATAVINVAGGTLGATTIANSGTVTVSGATVNVTGASGTGISNPSGAVFTLNSGTVTIGAAGGSNRKFTNAGTLTVAGGTLNINGNLAHSGTAFNHSGGAINIDPNAAGVAGNSSTSSDYTLNLTAPVNWTGGTITLVDPPASTSAFHYSVYYSNATVSESSASHTLRFGDAASSTAGGNAIGFYVYNSTGRLNAGNVVVNGPAAGTATATNRVVKLGTGFGVKGNFTLQNSAEFSHAGVELIVAGNINIDATSKYTANGTLTLALPSGTTSAVNTAAQTITYAGTIENVAGAATANLTSFTVNNSNATGVTLNNPLTMSGTFTLTSGIINTTTTNLLTLGTATAAGTLNNIGSATAYINGPFARTFGASRTASGSYGVATTFPVGTSAGYQAINVDPTTTAGGAVTFVAQAFTTNSGTQGVGVTTLSPRRWETYITNGAANFTNAFVRLRDDSIAATNKIVQSSSAAGEYAPVASVTNYATGILTTATALVGADYKGYFAFGDLNPCDVPANQPTAFVASSITNTTLTASFTAAATTPAPTTSHYLVVRYNTTPGAVTITDPVANTVYAVNATLGTGANTGTVVYNGTGTTFTQTGLTGANTYQYYVYSYNNTGCYGPIYNITSPLVQSVTTCATATGTPGTPAVVSSTGTTLNTQWTASSTAGVTYEIDVATNAGFTAFVPGYQALNVGSAVSANITGLTQGTTYYIRVRALSGTVCYSANSTSLTATTQYITTAPWTEGFAVASTVPAGWVAANWTVGTIVAGNTNIGIYRNLYVTVPTANVTTINVGTLPASQQLTLKYYYANYGDQSTSPAAGAGNIVVAVSTDYGVTYTDIGTVANDGTLGWKEYTRDLSAYAGSLVKIRVTGNWSSGDYYLALDDFKIDTIPACGKPQTSATAMASATSINASWTLPLAGTPTGYEYAVTTSATPPSSGTAAAGLSVSGITVTPNTSYYLHVRSVCGEGVYSDWLTTSFYSGYCLAPATDDDTIYITSFVTDGGYTNINNTSTFTTGGYSNFTTLSVSQSQGQQVNFTGDAYDYWGDGFEARVYVDWNNDFDFDDANEMVFDDYSLLSGSITVPAGTPVGNYRMRVRIDYDEYPVPACGTTTEGETEDYIFKVVPVPTCYVPAGLSAATATYTTANLSWSAPATAPVPSGYEYAVTTSATPPASGTATTATSVPGYSGLTLDTTYYLHVRSNCDANGYSDWTTLQFLQGYCSAASTSTGYYISSFATTGGASNISNSTSALSTGGYGNFTAMAVSQSEGNNVNFTVTPFNGTYTYGIAIWVDWNDDLTFDTSERMYNSAAYVASASSSFAVPMGAIIGNHRMRVRIDYYSTNPSACGAIQYGEAEDYTFTVIPSAPKITSFTPTAVCVGAGDTVTITGNYFTGATAVKFNGTDAASFNVVSATSITAVVPAAAATGTISVTSADGTGTSTGSLTVNQYPTVNDITGGGVSVCMPNTLQLSSTTTGGTWSSSDTNIATVSSTGLVTPVTAGTVTISYGVTTTGCTTTKTTTVTFNQPANITIQPASETVTPNSTLAFSVTATGTNLTYQWEVAADGVNFTPVTDGVTYDGTTTATLTINEATTGMNQYKYHVVVSGTAPCGSVTSGAATLTISDIGITSQPSNVTLCDSGAGTANFSVATTGSNLTFEWQQDAGTGTWLPLANGTVGSVTYSGADTNTLSLSGLTAANNAFRYRAFVQDGGATALSNPATLTVNSAAVINTQPANQVACSTGTTSNFVVDASGTGLTYQWQYATSAGGAYSNVTNATPLGVTYAGATTNTLAVTNATNTPVVPTYYYRVVITGTAPCGTVTSNPATLTINAPAISAPPAATTVVRSNSATFSVTTAAPAPTYQWQFSTTLGGTYSNVADSTPAGTTYSGDQSATLTVNAATTAVGTGYYYRVVVTSGGCTVTSAGAQLTVTDYCVGTVTNAHTTDYMTAISVATTSLNSTPGLVGNAANNYYALLTGSNNTATFFQAYSYTASVTVLSGNANPEGVGIWIDFNNDGDFADTNEFLGAASIASTATGTITMNIPANATTGSRRMRVRNVRNQTMTQGSVCTTYARGTTVDYIVTIAQPAGPAITSFTPDSYCADTGVITITGTNLTGGALTIGGTAVTPVVVNAAGTQLTATVNAGISGAVVITTPGGTATSSNFSVTAPPAVTLSAATGSICAGESSNVITLTAGGSSYDTFTVTSVPAGAPYSGNAATGYTFSPTVNTVYTIAGTQSGGTCARSATFTVTVKPNPVYPVTPATAEMCSGQIQALTISGAIGGTGIFGTGTTVSGNTDTTRPNPLSGYYGGQKAQMMFRASELSAQNMQAGSKINAITFNLGTFAASACTDFTIRMGSTSATDLTSGFATGTSAVYGPATFTPSGTGLVTFTLTTPFTWDGTSNIIVETVHNAGNGGNGSGSNTLYSVTSFNCSYFRMQDSVSGGIAGFDAATAGVVATSTSRPNMTFVFTNSGATWAPTTGLYTDAAATVAYTGTYARTVYAKPGTTTTYTATVNNGSGCSSSSSADITVNPKSWIGGTSADWNDPANWCGGQVPTALDNVVIADVTNQPIVSGNVTVVGNNLTVADGATLEVQGGSVLNITNAVTVAPTGSLTLDNYAHLLQGSSVTTNPNSGNIDVFRLSSPMYRLDYTMWSSPVENQKLKDFSPETLNNRFYIYNELTDEYATIADPVNTNMAEGRGYLIRVENTHPAYNATTNAPGTPWQGEFSGKPRSGNIDVPMSNTLNGYNAVGNPYPSPINIFAFYAANTNTIVDGSALYFWRKKNDASTGYYARVTKLAYTANTGNAWGDTGGTAFNGAPSSWVINPGQGFIVQSTGGTLHFNNAMRVGLNNQQFFRTAQNEEDAVISRLWLNVTGSEGQFAQAAIGYTDITTMGIDYGWDGKAFVNDGTASLFSLVGEEPLGIQARSEFDPADVVPMGFRVDTPGTYTITLDHMDGVFSGDQDIFLKDNLLGGITHDLKAGNYTFETEAGLFTSRFEVVYAEALGTNNPVLDANNVIVYKQGTSININAGVLEMTDVTIYDTRGRILYSKDGINATETVISNLHSDQQVLIIQINTEKGRVTKRIIY
ncbi:GEVED domain-containing protein [Flavobacterium sp. DGU11]|uniref:GEVED domain-containing protein n=1 Tax=Flavobacterium arundinis TaxID=3139143 RepID=A0ABU9HUE7_9FLAO